MWKYCIFFLVDNVGQLSLMFPNISKERLEQVYQSCCCDIDSTISALLGENSKNGKYCNLSYKVL